MHTQQPNLSIPTFTVAAAAAAAPTAAAAAFAPALVALMSTAACYEVVLARLLRAKSAPLEDPAFLMFSGFRASLRKRFRFGVSSPQTQTTVISVGGSRTLLQKW